MPVPTVTSTSRLSSPVSESAEDRQLSVALQSQDYLRRIHWWVRLAGVVWLATIAVTVLAFVTVAIVSAMSDDSDGLRSQSDTITSSTNGACSVFDSVTHQWRSVLCD